MCHSQVKVTGWLVPYAVLGIQRPADSGFGEGAVAAVLGRSLQCKKPGVKLARRESKGYEVMQSKAGGHLTNR